MKKLSLFVTALLLVFSLAACGDRGSDYAGYEDCEEATGSDACWSEDDEDFLVEDDAEIVIGVDSDDMGAALVQKWNEDFPEYEDMVEFENYGSANDDNSGMQGIELQEDEAPDVALVIDGEVIGREGSVLPLHEYFQEFGADETHESAFESINQLDYFYMPAFYDGMVFSWNETILEELDIDTTDSNDDNLPDAIDTWEKIFAISEEWEADDRPEIDVPGNDDSYTMYEMFPISLDEVWSGYSTLTAGGWHIFPDGELDEPGFDTDEFEAGLDFIKEFSETNMSVDETGSKKQAGEMGWRWDAYLQGAYPMGLVGTWQDVDGAEESTEFDFRFSKMPTYDGEDLHPLMKTKGFVINGFTPNPSAASKVLKWLYTEETFTTMIDSSAYLPSLQEDSIVFPEIDNENKEEFALGMENNHLEVSGTLPDNADVAAMDVFYNLNLNDYFKDIWDGETTPADARSAIVDDSEAWMEENNK
ncbi:MAG: extracellular solute-binding protein [Bacillota bacterium]